MCGIAGFFDGNADFTANREKYENILQKMQQSILPVSYTHLTLPTN